MGSEKPKNGFEANHVKAGGLLKVLASLKKLTSADQNDDIHLLYLQAIISIYFSNLI